MCKSCYSKDFWARKYSGSEKMKQYQREKSRRNYLANINKIKQQRALRKESDPDSWRAYFKEAQRKFRKRLKDNGIDEKDRYQFSGNKILVYERDGYKCVDCGITYQEYIKKGFGKMPVHHIDNNGYYKSVKDKNNDIDNLVTLCNACHCRETQRILHGHKPRTLEEFKN